MSTSSIRSTRSNRSRQSMSDSYDYDRSMPQTVSEAHVSCHDALNEGPLQPLSPGRSTVCNTPTKDDCVFDLLYRLVFVVVHMALSIILAPVVKSKKTSQPPSVCESSRPEHDPEIAITPTVNNIVHTTPVCHRERQVRFERRGKSSSLPVDRPRPPLGRMGVSTSYPDVASLSSCDSSVSSSSSGESVAYSHCSSSRDRRLNSVFGRHPLQRIRVAPRPRTQHAGFFLSD